MPYSYRKIRGKDLYKVFNKATGEIHANGTTLDKAKAQIRLLNQVQDIAGNYVTPEPMKTEVKKRGRPKKQTEKKGGAVFENREQYNQYKAQLRLINDQFQQAINRWLISDKSTGAFNNELMIYNNLPSEEFREFFESVRNRPDITHKEETLLNNLDAAYFEYAMFLQNSYGEIMNIVEDDENPNIQGMGKGRPKKENITMVITEKKRGRGRQKIGDGFFDDVRNYANTIKQGVTRATESVKQGIVGTAEKAKEGIVGTAEKVKEGIVGITEKAKEGVTTAVQKVKETGVALVKGRNDYPPKVRKIISEYGNSVITGISIHRTPLGKPLMTALQLASGNTFTQKLKNTPYDKLFHLFICIDFNGKSITLEKNEVINSERNCPLPKETESEIVSNMKMGVTFNEALEKTKERMGGKFFPYSAKDNNCQDFIVAFLQSNEFGTPQNISWVKQETKSLFEGDNNRLRKIANTLTDIGAKVDILRTGAGMKNKKPTEREQKYINQNRAKAKEEMFYTIRMMKRDGDSDDEILNYIKDFIMILSEDEDKEGSININEAEQIFDEYQAAEALLMLKKGKGAGQYTNPPQPNILQGDVVDEILNFIPDEDLTIYFGGLFEGASAVNPNQIYRIGSLRFVLTLQQYFMMRQRILGLRKKIEQSPRPTNRKRLDKDDKDDKGGDKGMRKGINLFGTGKIKSKSNVKMANPWIEYVKQYAEKNNMKYNEALKDPRIKEGYKSGKGVLEDIKAIGNKVGEPFKAVSGINPFKEGYDLGYNVIGPALFGKMKGKGRKTGCGMPTNNEAVIASSYEEKFLGNNTRGL